MYPKGTPTFVGFTPRNVTRAFNVKDYGAIGDGVADDTAACQAVLDAATAAGGSTVLDLNGFTLAVSGGLTLSAAPDVELRNGAIHLSGDALNVLTVDASPRFTLDGVTIDGNGHAANFIVDLDDSPDSVVRGCRITNHTRRASGAVLVGIYVRPTSHRTLVDGCYFYGLDGAGAAARGVYMNDHVAGAALPGSVTVRDCTFEMMPDATDSDAIVWGGPGAFHADGLVHNCRFIDVAKRAVKVMCSAVEVRGGFVQRRDAGVGNGFAVVGIYDGSDVTVTGLRGVMDAGRYYSVVTVQDSDRVVLEDIAIHYPAANTSVVGAAFDLVGTALGSVVIRGCEVNRCQFGVRAVSTARLVVEGNAFSGITSRPFWAVSSSAFGRVVIEGNDFRDGSSNDVAFSGSTFDDVRYVGNVSTCSWASIPGDLRDAPTRLVAYGNLRPEGALPEVYGDRLRGVGSDIPTWGAHIVGDMYWRSSPTAGGTMGWVCTTAGTPGTWKAFGTVAA